jgi:hypothetical protein
LSTQLLWQPAVAICRKLSASQRPKGKRTCAEELRGTALREVRYALKWPRFFFAGQELTNPYWLQQVFRGHSLPGTLAYCPHSATALQFETHPEPQ